MSETKFIVGPCEAYARHIPDRLPLFEVVISGAESRWFNSRRDAESASETLGGAAVIRERDWTNLTAAQE
jgi:hypothetical protein